MEDYAANRKAKSAGGATAGGGLFGSNPATSTATGGFGGFGGATAGGLGGSTLGARQAGGFGGGFAFVFSTCLIDI